VGVCSAGEEPGIYINSARHSVYVNERIILNCEAQAQTTLQWELAQHFDVGSKHLQETLNFAPGHPNM
jgi:hypothetical protein